MVDRVPVGATVEFVRCEKDDSESSQPLHTRGGVRRIMTMLDQVDDRAGLEPANKSGHRATQQVLGRWVLTNSGVRRIYIPSRN